MTLDPPKNDIKIESRRQTKQLAFFFAILFGGNFQATNRREEGKFFCGVKAEFLLNISMKGGSPILLSQEEKDKQKASGRGFCQLEPDVL